MAGSPEVIELLDDSSDGSSSEEQPLRLQLKQKGQRQSQRVRRVPTRTGDVVRTDYLPSGDSSNSDEDYEEHVSKRQRLQNAAKKAAKSPVSSRSGSAALKIRQTPSMDRPKLSGNSRVPPTTTTSPTVAARKESDKAKAKVPIEKSSVIPKRVRLAARKSVVRIIEDTEDDEEDQDDEVSDDFDDDQPIRLPNALKYKSKTVVSVSGRNNGATTKHDVATHPNAARKSVTPTAKSKVIEKEHKAELKAEELVKERSSSEEKLAKSPVHSSAKDATESPTADAGTTLTAASLKTERQVATKFAVSSVYVNTQKADFPVVTVATPSNPPNSLVPTLPAVPITHSTGWRCLRIDRTPRNIISTGKSYSAEFDRPLSYYDESGALAKQCVILATFNSEPKKKRRLDLSKKATLICNPVEIKRKVRALVETELPRIQSCHQRRVNHIVKGARRDVKNYLENFRLQNANRRSICRHYEPSQIEQFYRRRQLQNRPDDPDFHSLDGSVWYLLGRGETDLGDAKYEKKSDRTSYPRICCPESVVRLSDDITCLRQSKACIGVAKNCFVPDDPILRYLPYFGKNGTVRIDPELYDATTMDQAKKFLVAESSTGVNKTDGELMRVPESALDDEVKEYLLRMIVATFGDGPEVFDAVKEELGLSKPFEDYVALKKMYDGIDSARSRIAAVQRVVALTKKRNRDSTEKDAVAARSVTIGECVALLAEQCWFLQGHKDPKSLTTRLTPPIPYFESNYTRYPTCGGLRKHKDYGQVIDPYRDLFCRRCFVYDCEEHGIQHPLPLERIDPVNPVVRKSGLALRRAQNDKDAEAALDDDGEDSDMIEILSDEEEDEVKALFPPKSAPAPVVTVDNEPRRRSKRSRTRADTLASAALQAQEAIQESQRLLHLRSMTKQQRRGIQAVDISEYLDDSYAEIVAAPVKALMAKNASCCKTCWRLSCEREDSTSPPDDEIELNDVQAVLISKLLSIFDGNTCVAAAAVKSSTLSCSHIARFQKSNQLDGNATWREPSPRTANRRKNSSSAPHSNREILRRMKNQQKDDYTPRYQPCKHDGPCDGACECVINGTRCDMACACFRGCSNRFQGCKCSMANCRTNACPCFSVGRECDPDFCFSCGASEAAVMAFDSERKREHSHELGICANVNLLRGTHRKVGIAFSSTHGWGAFALEPIPKGEYVLEYTGSLISDEEAERRGVIYDRISSSFLFKINSDETVDAARKGNKSKFANHKPEGKGNCEAKIRVVRGEHRIALFAKDNIAVGEEIFYDYGHKGETAPDWHQKILRSSTP